MSIAERLTELHIVLPPANTPQGSYVPAVSFGNILFSAGQVARENGVVSKKYRGKMGDTISLDVGYEAARICAINCLAAIQQELGSLDKVERIVKVTGFINATADFMDNAKVLNGASDLLLKIFGDSGRHARSAIGVQALPAGAVCEVEMIVQLK